MRIKFPFKHNSYLLSSFILFNKFSINSQIAPRLRVNFTSVKVTKEIKIYSFNRLMKVLQII